MISDMANVKIAHEETEIKRLEEELRTEERNFKHESRINHRRRRSEVTAFMKKELEATKDNVDGPEEESSVRKDTQNTKNTEITEEEAEQLLNEYDDIRRLEAELFEEEIPKLPEQEETQEEMEMRAKLEAKRKFLEEKKIKRQQLEEAERNKILREEAEVRRLERELLQEESAFDRELDERRRKREANDDYDYDWDKVTEDPLASGSDEEVEDDETTRIIHANKDVKSLEVEVFGNASEV